ncbi:hypothetical protein HMN09_00245800 [Mycena chlorophos]|uniref:Glycosyltransferase 61 catalytic domain-containing protein n=1 Tax=Mycena chlorophos TaxID=658473 RepID=A0A8H6TK91_MYCCL|nr:hypothetical protein HMN09_00245800 [Mycena chlorophos]
MRTETPRRSFWRFSSPRRPSPDRSLPAPLSRRLAHATRQPSRRAYLVILLTVVVLILLRSTSRVKPSPTGNNFATALEDRTSPSSPSSLWAPFSLSTCVFGMPRHWAPCFAQRLANVLYAEELVYPDFQLREPYFPNNQQREVWRKFAQTDSEYRDRASLKEGWATYKGQHGQNFVFHDVSYKLRFGPDIWSSRSCTQKLVNTLPIEPTNRTTKDVLPTALIALAPEAFSFQHFLDRVTHIIVQGEHLHDGHDTYALTGRLGTRLVQQMWDKMGFPDERLIHSSKSIAADQLVFSCRALLVHPWLSLKTLELLGVGDRQTPAPQRNKVVYMSRSDGHALNGRHVVNEEEVLTAIRALLEERKLGEELVVFLEDAFDNIHDLFSWFKENALAIVGPHGGAMINHRWAHRDTFVLEFMPENRMAMMIHEEASMLSQTYAAIVVPPVTPDSFDLLLDVGQVVDLLRTHLGVVGAENPLRRSYYWEAKELGLDL